MNRPLVMILLLQAATGAVAEVLDPTQPVAVLDTACLAFGVATSGDLVLVSDHDAGLLIVDLATPAIVGAVDTPGFASDVVVSGGLAYVADFDRGIQVIDVSVPATPLLVGGLDADGHALVADAAGGLQVIALADPASPTVTTSYGTVGNALHVAVRGRFAVMACGGDGLASGDHPAGRHAYAWDGRDDAGRRLPSGVYCTRLTAGDRHVTMKLTLVE